VLDLFYLAIGALGFLILWAITDLRHARATERAAVS